ncbi:MAG: hypothetical protein NVS9B7_05540 [Flavisolibacter sp.]
MNKLLSALVCLLVLPHVYGQKIFREANAESRTVSSFHSLQISGGIDLVLNQSGQEGLAVSASEKQYVAQIKTNVENGVLKIWYEGREKWWHKMHNPKMKAYVSVRNLDEIRASGASDIQIEGKISTSNLKLSCSGASDLKGTLEVSGNLRINLSGASDLKINGSAFETMIKVHGASDMKGYDFKTGVCSIEASGASGVHITVEKEISAAVSGASSVSYKGDAKTKDIKVSGASNIEHKS